jgi:outer membrane putative beta-barrel porin/alpha-amylase
MSKAFGVVLFGLMLSSISSLAQGPCPTANSTATSTIPARSGDLICLVPQVYGGGGLVGTDHGGPLFSTTNQFSHAAHFTSSAIQSFSPLNAEIGTQLSQLPFTSPASGFIFSFNASLGVVSRQTENFGPILTERADTIGKHKLFVGFSYQYFNFDKADGVNLKNFGVVFQHEPEAGLCTPTSPLTCVNGEPVFQQDVIATQNRIDLKVHQLTAVGTFGVTDRLDVSVAVPILDVRMAVTSGAVINSFETAADVPPCCVHRFVPTSGDVHENFIDSAHATFFNNNTSSGIGDVIFRGKFQALKGEKAGLAVGLDVHLPTGDEKSFLGSGTWGLRPFAAFSYAGRISPHASFGYQRNGDSVLAGDITTDTSAHLPDIVTYSAGADAGVTHRITLSADFLGQSLVSAKKIAASTFTDVAGGTHSNIVTSTATINQASFAVGGKINPIGNLLITANVLFRVNDAGLHSKPVPLVGVSYTF